MAGRQRGVDIQPRYYPSSKRRRRPSGRPRDFSLGATASGGLSLRAGGARSARGTVRGLRRVRTHGVLHVSRDGGELLCTGLQLLAQLAAEVRLPLQQLRNCLRTGDRPRGESRLGLREASLEHVTGDGVMETREALQCLEPVLLGLAE